MCDELAPPHRLPGMTRRAPRCQLGSETCTPSPARQCMAAKALTALALLTRCFLCVQLLCRASTHLHHRQCTVLHQHGHLGAADLQSAHQLAHLVLGATAPGLLRKSPHKSAMARTGSAHHCLCCRAAGILQSERRWACRLGAITEALVRCALCMDRVYRAAVHHSASRMLQPGGRVLPVASSTRCKYGLRVLCARPTCVADCTLLRLCGCTDATKGVGLVEKNIFLYSWQILINFVYLVLFERSVLVNRERWALNFKPEVLPIVLAASFGGALLPRAHARVLAVTPFARFHYFPASQAPRRGHEGVRQRGRDGDPRGVLLLHVRHTAPVRSRVGVALNYAAGRLCCSPWCWPSFPSACTTRKSASVPLASQAGPGCSLT